MIRTRHFRGFFLAFLGGSLALASGLAAARAAVPDGITVYRIKPSTIDARVKHDDWPNWVMFNPAAPANAPLVLWLPGTHGKPGSRGDRALMELIVEQGYRLIWLAYDNDISVSKLCPHSPDPHCSSAFRDMRIYGATRGISPVTNPPAESVVARFANLLSALRNTYPKQHWGQYLNQHGLPDWSRIVVAGHSSGAGMAALIAKQHKVARVVLFSSPWDDWHPAGHIPRRIGCPGPAPRR